MKKWVIAGATALIAIVAITGVAVALMDSGGGDDGGPSVSRPADENDGSDTDTAPICIEGAIDCNDTPTEPLPDGDVCIQIFPTPPECADPDEPVSNDPGSSDGGAGFRTCLELTEHNTISCGDAAVAISTRELAGRLGSADGIALKSLEQVDWPDSCLGVNQADVACAEVISPGYRVILEANGETYEYHTQGLTRAVLVE